MKVTMEEMIVEMLRLMIVMVNPMMKTTLVSQTMKSKALQKYFKKLDSSSGQRCQAGQLSSTKVPAGDPV